MTPITTNEIAEVIAMYIQNDLMPVANNPLTRFMLGFSMNTIKAKPIIITNLINQHPIIGMVFGGCDSSNSSSNNDGNNNSDNDKDDNSSSNVTTLPTFDADMVCDILEATLKDQPLHLNLKTESFDIPAEDIKKIRKYVKEVTA